MNNKGLTNEINTTSDRAYLWDLREGNLVKIPVTLKSFQRSRGKIHFEVESKYKATLHLLIGGSGLLKFFMPDNKLAFESDLLHQKENEIIVSDPIRIKRYDRREGKRLEPLMPIVFNTNGRRFNCVDISEGGLSIVLGVLELPFLNWKVGQKLRGTLSFPTQFVEANAAIVGIEHIPPYKNERYMYGAYRISFMFQEKYGSIASEINKMEISLNRLLNDLK